MKSQRDKNRNGQISIAGSCQLYAQDLHIMKFSQFSNLRQNCVTFCQNRLVWPLIAKSSQQSFALPGQPGYCHDVHINTKSSDTVKSGGVGAKPTWKGGGAILPKWTKLGSAFIQMHSWFKSFEVAGEIFSGWWDIFDSSDIDFLITLLKRQFNYREDVDCEKIDSQQTGNNESLLSLQVFIVKENTWNVVEINRN